MPELPEVETTKRGIEPHLRGQRIIKITIRQPQLRFLVPSNLVTLCTGQKICSVSRRGKYLLVHLTEGYLLIHLGMSGHLRLVDHSTPLKRHDHLEFLLENNKVLRYNDPRRFGFILYATGAPDEHHLLSHLGPEPLSSDFNSDTLAQRATGKKQTIKALIMRSDVVVGIGNIYASESLYLAKIHPQIEAGKLERKHFCELVSTIKLVLQQAIDEGGTTLRDFYAADGKPGYFVNQLKVYARKNLPCLLCHTTIESIKISGRSSFFCPECQSMEVV